MQDGDTDTDLSDMESVASFSSDVDEERSSKKKTSTVVKRSWFTITLGAAKELEKEEDEDDNDDSKFDDDGNNVKLNHTAFPSYFFSVQLFDPSPPS